MTQRGGGGGGGGGEPVSSVPAAVELAGSGVSNIFSSAFSHCISVWRGTLNEKRRREEGKGGEEGKKGGRPWPL